MLMVPKSDISSSILKILCVYANVQRFKDNLEKICDLIQGNDFCVTCTLLHNFYLQISICLLQFCNQKRGNVVRYCCHAKAKKVSNRIMNATCH